MKTVQKYSQVSLFLAVALSLAILFAPGSAFSYENSDTKFELDEAEMQLLMVRTFIKTLKLNVTAEEGRFDINQYPEGANFGDVARVIEVAKKDGTVQVKDQAYSTTHEVWIKEKDSGRPELYALLGDSTHLGSGGKRKVGLFAIMAGSTDLEQALMVAKFSIDEVSGEAIIEVKFGSWSFERDKDVVECKDPVGGVRQYHEGVACSYPADFSADKQHEIEEAIHNRLSSGSESFTAVASEYGMSCN